MNTFFRIFAFFLLIAFSVSCSEKKTAQVTETQNTDTTNKAVTPEVVLTADQYKVADIQLGKIEMRNLNGVIKVNGEIDVPPQNTVSISAPLGGYIKSAGLLPGQAVRKGQVIAVIENTQFIDIQQDYLESKGRLVYVTQELQRQKELRK